jgi:hypothetical protein
MKIIKQRMGGFYMKSKIYIIIFWGFIQSFNLFCQREADVLIGGACLFVNDPPNFYNCNPPYGQMLLKFNEDSLVEIDESQILNLSTFMSRAAFADKNTGELLFASNGWRLINGSGQVLSYKLWSPSIPKPNDTPDSTYVMNTLAPLFLNDPGDSTKAYLFYGQYQLNFAPILGPDIPKADQFFTYAYLDIPTQTLISQNNLILNEFTSAGDLSATRHANGRDWWIVKPGIYDDEYYVGLLSPSGIQMEKRTIPNVVHRGRLESYTYFNEDGSKLIHFTHKKWKYVYEFEFDRCAGTLSQPIIHDLVDSIPMGDYNACSISPDGSKLYIRRSGSLDGTLRTGTFQYDLQTRIFHFISNNGANPILTPNFKNILYNDLVTNNNINYDFFNIIKYPNEVYPNCVYITNIDTVINAPVFASPPNFANFRLGKLAGSPCDTIVSSISEQLKVKSVKVFPNPTQDVLHLEFPYPVEKPYQISIVDVMGKVVYSGNLAAEGGSLSLTQLGLSKGLYVLHAQRDGKGYSRRFVYEN